MASVQLITIGAAVQDVFLEGKVFEPQNEDGQLVDEFVLGSKNEVEKECSRHVCETRTTCLLRW
jgi:hypothetical protein